MPKVTITIQDNLVEPDASQQGNIKIDLDFDPEIKVGETASPAQNFAITMLHKFGVIQEAENLK